MCLYTVFSVGVAYSFYFLFMSLSKQYRKHFSGFLIKTIIFLLFPNENPPRNFHMKYWTPLFFSLSLSLRWLITTIELAHFDKLVNWSQFVATNMCISIISGISFHIKLLNSTVFVPSWFSSTNHFTRVQLLQKVQRTPFNGTFFFMPRFLFSPYLQALSNSCVHVYIHPYPLFYNEPLTYLHVHLMFGNFFSAHFYCVMCWIEFSCPHNVTSTALYQMRCLQSSGTGVFLKKKNDNTKLVKRTNTNKIIERIYCMQISSLYIHHLSG